MTIKLLSNQIFKFSELTQEAQKFAIEANRNVFIDEGETYSDDEYNYLTSDHAIIELLSCNIEFTNCGKIFMRS